MAPARACFLIELAQEIITGLGFVNDLALIDCAKVSQTTYEFINSLKFAGVNRTTFLFIQRSWGIRCSALKQIKR
jgi:hypothetical protein